MILANTLFQCVCYHPDEFQIITSGTDRKVGTLSTPWLPAPPLGIPSTPEQEKIYKTKMVSIEHVQFFFSFHSLISKQSIHITFDIVLEMM